MNKRRLVTLARAFVVTTGQQGKSGLCNFHHFFLQFCFYIKKKEINIIEQPITL